MAGLKNVIGTLVNGFSSVYTTATDTVDYTPSAIPSAQDDVIFTSMEDVKNKNFFAKYTPQVTFPSGACTIDITEVYNKVQLIGDTRECAGRTYAGTIAIYSASTNSGSGVCTLATTAANTITVTGAGGNPDFSAVGNVWDAGDSIIIVSDTGVVTLDTITSISGAGHNEINTTGAAPTVGGMGSSITLVPNRTIASQVVLRSFNDIEFQGFLFSGAVTSELILNYGNLKLSKCVVYDPAGTHVGITNEENGYVESDHLTSIINNTYSLACWEKSKALCSGTNFIKSSSSGISGYRAYGNFDNSRIFWCTASALIEDWQSEFSCQNGYVDHTANAIVLNRKSTANLANAVITTSGTKDFVASNMSLADKTGATATKGDTIDATSLALS